jgi:hypothetical protein
MSLAGVLRGGSRVVLVVVLGCWCAALGADLWLVRHFGRDLPFWDECTQVPVLSGEEPVTAGWIWRPYNEHRIPLPRLVLLAVARASHLDHRAGMYLNVVLLAVVSLILTLAVAAARGRLVWGDCIIPLALLNLGHYVNLLAQFQIVFVLTAVLGCLVLASLALLADQPSRIALSGLAVSLVALPLTGTAGLVQALPVAVWLIGAGAFRLIRGSRHGLGTSAAMVATGSLCAVIALLTGSHLLRRAVPTNGFDVNELAPAIVSCMATSFGVGAGRTPWLWTGVVVFVLVTVVAGLMTALPDPRERLRALGILAYISGVLLMMVTIAVGRTADSSAPRYMTLSVQLLCAAWVGCIPGPRNRCREGLVAAALLGTLIVLLPATTRAAVKRGVQRSSVHRRLVDDLRGGAPLAAIGQWYAQEFCPGEASVQATLRTLARHHLGPFRDGTILLTDTAPGCDEEPVAGAADPTEGTATTRTTWRLVGELPDLVLAVTPARELCGLRLVVEMESTGPRRSRAALRFTTSPPDGGEARPRRVELKFAGSGRFERTVWVHGVVGRVEIRLDPAMTAFQISSVTLLTPAGSR